MPAARFQGVFTFQKAEGVMIMNRKRTEYLLQLMIVILFIILLIKVV